jgi:hypothetical protein
MGSSINFKVKGIVSASFSSKGRNFLKLKEEETGESQEFFAQLGRGVDLIPSGTIVTLEGFSYPNGVCIVTSVMIHVSASPSPSSEGIVRAVAQKNWGVSLLVAVYDGNKIIDDDQTVDEDGRTSPSTITTGYQKSERIFCEPVWFNCYQNRFPKPPKKGDEIYFRSSQNGNIFELEIISSSTVVHKAAKKEEVIPPRKAVLPSQDSLVDELRNTLAITASNLEVALSSSERMEKEIFGLRAENWILQQKLNDAVKSAEFLQSKEGRLPELGAESLFDDPSGDVGIFSPHSQGRLGATGTIDSSWDEEEELLPF